MNDVVVFTMPIALVSIGVIVLLHITCAVLGALSPRTAFKVMSLVFAVLNGVAHLFLVGYSIFKDLPSGELLCLLMLSAAVGMVSMGLSEKHKKTEEGV